MSSLQHLLSALSRPLINDCRSNTSTDAKMNDGSLHECGPARRNQFLAFYTNSPVSTKHSFAELMSQPFVIKSVGLGLGPLLALTGVATNFIIFVEEFITRVLLKLEIEEASYEQFEDPQVKRSVKRKENSSKVTFAAFYQRLSGRRRCRFP